MRPLLRLHQSNCGAAGAILPAAIVTTIAILAHANAVHAGSQPAFELRTVALTGQHATGTPAGTVFSTLEGQRIDESGRVAFYGMLSGPGISDANNAGVWSEGHGQLRLVAREGDQAPGLAPGTLLRVIRRNSGGFTDPVPALEANLGFDSNGNVAFMAMLIGGEVIDADNNGFYENDEAWFGDAGGALSLLVKTGQPVPGQAPGVTFRDFVFTPFGPPIVARDGRIGGSILTQGPGITTANDVVLFVIDQSGFRIVAREGDAAPGIPGALFAGFGSPRFGFRNGQPIFYILSSLTGTGITTSNDSALWRVENDQFTLIAREGESVGGTSTRLTFRNTSVTAPDSFAFVSLLSGNQQGLFRVGTSGVDLLATAQTQGNSSPGLHFTLFSTFSGIGGPLQTNAAGQVAFFAMLDGEGVVDGTRMSLWRAEPDASLTLIARDEEPAPGAGGLVFGAFHIFDVFTNTFQAPAMNESGQMAFHAFIRPPGPPGTFENFQSALFMTDSQGAPSLVVRQSDIFDVSGNGSDLRTVSNVSFHGRGAVASESTSEAYNGASLTEDGTIVFRLTFTDGSQGIFTARAPNSTLIGDIDGDGDIDLRDVELMVLALIGTPSAPVHFERSDVNSDGATDGGDVSAMVNLLLAP